MLKVINLYVIDRIFSDSESKISPKAKMLYINCLTHHFKEKSATVSNAIAFEMFEEDFGDFSRFRVPMQELHRAGLIEIGVNKIAFHNTWGKYIDRTQLEKVNAMEYVAGFSFNGIEHFKADLVNNNSIIELASMKYSIKKEDLPALIELFIAEQKTFDKKYSGFSDCIKHFTYWLPNNIKKLTTQTPTTVKSKGKILGI
jgi:hypothetical protein